AGQRAARGAPRQGRRLLGPRRHPARGNPRRRRLRPARRRGGPAKAVSDSLPPLVVGVDTGGTFTDFMVIAPGGAVYTHKRLSTPHDPGQAVLDGLAEL